jgi:Leucine-rich repeat (LRR) protein
LKKLQETLEEGAKVEELEDVRLCMIPWQMPLIAKMDTSLGTLKKCKHLRLSSNTIDRIGSLAGMGARSLPRPRASRRRQSRLRCVRLLGSRARHRMPNC